ncbi:MAG: hypothetical protein OWR62_08085 [Sulfobacillus thermotolerans]|uniref:Uncharacterized protein n=1 Tax=Sulfobacillus thermotolerans TaxID=338644 RepID=A0ABM6RSM0_9FIRM|nr:hypothetical protein BXT84_11240 [Sulfobacillus thermotolerans]MCY0908331.1 hypothetical protein [Sulfobacillus thermotolerans]
MAKISREELIKHLTPPPGIIMPPYPAKRDKVYRMSLGWTALAMVAAAVATLMRAEQAMFWIQGLVSAGLAVAGWTFLVWLKQWRWIVRSLVVLGLVLWPFWSLGAWALTIAGSAIMAAKETHCFHFWAGRVIPWYSVLFGAGMVFGAPWWLMGLLWLGLAFLWLSLVRGRWTLPLFEV